MKAGFFPLGDTRSKHDSNLSNWKELSLAYQIIKQAITPKLKLKYLFDKWGEISEAFQEKRKRKLRIHEFLALS